MLGMFLTVIAMMSLTALPYVNWSGLGRGLLAKRCWHFHDVSPDTNGRHMAAQNLVEPFHCNTCGVDRSRIVATTDGTGGPGAMEDTRRKRGKKVPRS